MRKLLLVLSLFAAIPAFAKDYPWVSCSAQDLRVMTTAKMDLAVRLDVIRRAQRTIDVAIYEQAADESVGLPVLSALRDAADRGVKVRFLTNWVSVIAKDITRKAIDYALNPPTRTPIEYVVFGGRRQEHGGWKWSWADQVHEKLLIIDGGEITLVTGRGHSDGYLTWLDTSFLIRGPLSTQAQEAFNALWNTVKIEEGPIKSDPKKARDPKRSYGVISAMRLNPFEQAELATHDAWMNEGVAPLSARTARGRVLHFDFVKQFQDNGYRHMTADERVKKFVDPVVDSVVEKLDGGARVLKYTTLSPILHPKFRLAMQRAAARGARIVIQTNGLDAGFDPLNVPYRLGLVDMLKLMPTGNVELHGLSRKEYGSPWTYLHRKLAVIDGDTVIFGSHNLNLPSSTYNDELSFEIEDEEFARVMNTQFDEDLVVSSVLVTLDDVKKQYRNGLSFLSRTLGKYLRGLM